MVETFGLSRTKVTNPEGGLAEGVIRLFRKPCLHLGVGKGSVDFPVELIDDFTRCVRGRAEDEA
jgi:hypothetical protein